MNKITIIEPCNFIDSPTGGQLIFAKQITRILHENLKLVGFTTEKKIKIGRWTTLTLNGHTFEFFPFMRTLPREKKGIIPARLKVVFYLLRFRKRILDKCHPVLIISAPEVLALFYKSKKFKTIYIFPGTGNALSISKYYWARPFARIYDRWLMPKVAKAYKILAAADTQSIHELEIRSKGKIKPERVIQFPTRIDEEFFKKMPFDECRKKIDIPIDFKIILTCGRLCYFKGWVLMLDAFKLFMKDNPKSIFIFIGDGEDEQKIRDYSKQLGVIDNVRLAGFQKSETIATYLNASDIFVMGSFQEGWSTTLVEAACCGVPSVVTDFSSARDIISNGINGYVVEDRDPNNFYFHMNKAILLDRSNLPSKEMLRFGLKSMKEEIIKIINE